MTEPEVVSEFKKGLTALRMGSPESAVAHFEKAVEMDKGNPFYLSYYGLALSRARSDWVKAVDSCLDALKMKRTEPHLYLNLAELYRQIGNVEYALNTIYNGLQFTRWDRRLVQALEIMGVRRPPVLSFLDRKNLLNRQLGKLRHRLQRQGNLSALERLRLARG